MVHRQQLETTAEDSSCELAALESQCPGGVTAVIACSFARFYDTHSQEARDACAYALVDPAAYDDIKIEDKLDVLGADDLKLDVDLVMQVRTIKQRISLLDMAIEAAEH
jgi:hypothetical protein